MNLTLMNGDMKEQQSEEVSCETREAKEKNRETKEKKSIA